MNRETLRLYANLPMGSKSWPLEQYSVEHSWLCPPRLAELSLAEGCPQENMTLAEICIRLGKVP